MRGQKMILYGLGNGPEKICSYWAEENIPQSKAQNKKNPRVTNPKLQIFLYTVMVLVIFIDLALGLVLLIRVGFLPVIGWAFANALELYLLKDAALL